MKQDEKELLLKAYGAVKGTVNGGPCVEYGLEWYTEFVPGMSAKRAEYLLEKWHSKRWWDYGVTLRTGWLTSKGIWEASRLEQKK